LSFVKSVIRLLANDLDQDAFLAPAVEFTVEDLLPGPEIQRSIRNSHNNLPSHNLPLVVCITVFLAGAIVVIAFWAGVKGRKSFQPSGIVFMQSRLVVVDENAGSLDFPSDTSITCL
jgi:hypothetical protein